MAVLPGTRPPLQRPDRRSFLWSLASLGFPSRIPKPKKQSEQVYRFLTPVCEVRMSVQYFASSSTSSFRFRDDLMNRTFCLSANGEQDRDCLGRFVGSMAIAQYPPTFPLAADSLIGRRDLRLHALLWDQIRPVL
jgi:hypothetical protein